jgi:hypothetical protein
MHMHHPRLRGPVRPVQAFTQLNNVPKRQISHIIDLLCDKFDSLPTGDLRRDAIVGYISWLNVEFQAAD